MSEHRLILSNRFKKVLVDIQNMKQSTISRRLLELENSDKLFDVSFVDIDEEGENVTYLQSNRIDRLKKEGKPVDEFWTTKMRTQQKIGRFIKQILPKFNDNSILKFSNKFKVILKESKEEVNFELVDGYEIIHWYDKRNYEDQEAGSLGGTCMGAPAAGRYLNIYKNNPNQCKMLILKTENGEKIKGRALVWKLSSPKDKIFMDRVYVNEYEDELLFTNYAKRHGWLYKDEQKYGAGIYIIVPGKGTQEMELEVVLEDTNFNLYPYVDTLRYFYPELKLLATHDMYINDYLILTDTEGHYEGYDTWTTEKDPTVYDGFNKKEIPESRAIWCKYDNSHIAIKDSIRLPNNEYAFPNSPYIVFSDYTKKWYVKDECVFSKPLNTWIWKKYAVDVYHDIDKKTKPDKTHSFELNKSIGKVGNDYYDIDLLYVVATKQVHKHGKVKKEVTYAFRPKS